MHTDMYICIMSFAKLNDTFQVALIKIATYICTYIYINAMSLSQLQVEYR